MTKKHSSMLGLLSLLACSGGIAPIEVGLDDCASQGGCQADEFCAEGFCFAQRCVVNGKLEPGEACDDGNASELDGCSNQCTLARCGDGLVREDKNPGTAGYEACDDGNENNADACTNDCRLPNCGDGFVAEGEGEACDDGNLENADACLNDCSLARCGDGILREGLALGDVGFEACDDGDDIDENACTTACRVARCGDGIRRTDQPVGTNDFEACDDGNDDETDACLSDCGEASCGDGVLRTDQAPGDEGYEACDDGNDEELDDCTTVCEPPRCGDGFDNGRPGAEEACDDGNEDNSDACLNDCSRARCGDGFRRGDLAVDHPGYEACDDGNAIETDVCLSGCQLNRCGDGHVLAGTEACDDGNDDQQDGCLNDCSVARCGDGFVRDGEEACDDANDVDTDGCRDDCRLSRCGDGVLRTDLVTMSSPGFEACEPDLDDHDGRCRSDCLLGRPPRILVAALDYNCVLRSGRVWCWGEVMNRPDQGNGFIDGGPVEWLGDFGDLRSFGQSQTGYICLLGGQGRGMCHNSSYWSHYVGPSWPVALMDLSPRGARGQQCLLDVQGRVACLSGASPHPQALDLEGVVAISIDSYLGCAVTLDGRVFCWSEAQPEPVLVDDQGTAVAVELARGRAQLNLDGELSGIAYVLRADGRLEALPPDMPAVTGITGPVKRLSFNGHSGVPAGGLGEDACAVTVGGALFCTGATLLPSAEHRSTGPSEFIEIPLEEAAVDVAVGSAKGTVLLASGTVLTWGFLQELDGLFMRPLSLDRFQRTPVPVLGLPDPEAP